MKDNRFIFIFLLLLLSNPILADGKNEPNNEPSTISDSASSLDKVENHDNNTNENDAYKQNNNQTTPSQRQLPPLKDMYQLQLNINYSGQEKFDNQEELSELLKKHLSLYTRQKSRSKPDEDQISYWVQETHKEVHQILSTKGFFNSKTDIKKENDTYIINIDIGEQIKISNIVLLLNGVIESDDDLPKFYRDIFLSLAFRPNAPFTQDDWSAGKTSVLTVVTAKKYPLAKIEESLAKIDPEKNSAELFIRVDSRDLVRFGEINITGTQRYPESLPRNLATFQSGEDYNLNKLLDYQQLLENDGHYSSVSVYADFDNISEDNIVPVNVVLTEVPRQKLDIGLQYDTADGVGTRIGYDHYNMFKRGYTGSAVISANRYEQIFGVGISQPRDEKGHFYTSNISVKNKKLQGLESQNIGLGFWKARIRHGIDSRVGIEHYRERERIELTPTWNNSYVTMLTASWKTNRIETRERPSNGYYFSGKVGTTVGSILSSANVQRVTADAAYYYTPRRRSYGTWIVHGGLGYVRTANQEKVPTDLLFRIGGIDTVRGYETESIGMPGPTEKVVLGGKVMATVGLEYQYPIRKDWSVAVFHDAGDVKNRFKDLKLKHATGVGVRWFSPIAPLAFDIAYAHENKEIGWYITLGARF